MIGVARVNDLVHGVCDGPGHARRRPFTGRWATGSQGVFADGMPVALVGSVGTTDCGHHFIAITGSAIAFADGVGVHRVGDLVSVCEGGEGVTLTGSDTLFSE